MKRVSAIFLAALFVVGVLLIPSVHQACFEDGHARHDMGNCSICHVAHTPLQLTSAALIPGEPVLMADVVFRAVTMAPRLSPRSATQARAPPV
jgi:hypothetical protein